MSERIAYVMAQIVECSECGQTYVSYLGPPLGPTEHKCPGDEIRALNLEITRLRAHLDMMGRKLADMRLLAAKAHEDVKPRAQALINEMEACLGEALPPFGRGLVSKMDRRIHGLEQNERTLRDILRRLCTTRFGVDGDGCAEVHFEVNVTAQADCLIELDAFERRLANAAARQERE